MTTITGAELAAMVGRRVRVRPGVYYPKAKMDGRAGTVVAAEVATSAYGHPTVDLIVDLEGTPDHYCDIDDVEFVD